MFSVRIDLAIIFVEFKSVLWSNVEFFLEKLEF